MHECQTYGQQFEAALACNTPEEAEAWMEKEVVHYVEHHQKAPEEAIKIIKINVGYMAGYYDDATAKKIHRLFNAVHPIFGTANYHKTMPPEEAFKLGMQAFKPKE